MSENNMITEISELGKIERKPINKQHYVNKLASIYDKLGQAQTELHVFLFFEGAPSDEIKKQALKMAEDRATKRALRKMKKHV